MPEPIDRQALLEAYDRAHKGPPGGARKLIAEAPTIEPEVRHGRWIPCSERLPEDESPVIIAHIDSDGYGLPCIGMFRGNPKKWMSTSAIRIVNVTHWMPLPEPPEKE